MTMVSTDYLRFVLALALVLGLICLVAWIARRFRLGGFPGGGRSAGRLRLVESLPIDARQRLVLVRRDDREHLLLIGPEGGRVIEQGIEATMLGDDGMRAVDRPDPAADKVNEHASTTEAAGAER
jgi:flagellar protein FliO/FliZ